MSKYQFMQEVTDQLSARPELRGCRVEGKVYIRNNDVHSYGISVIRSENRVNPIFYIDRFYDGYCRKKKTVDETADDLLQLMQQIEEESSTLSDVSLAFEDCRESIVFRLVSASKNEEYLSCVPFVPFMDLAIIFTVVLSDREDGIKSVRITDELMEDWGTTTGELMGLARVNTPRIFPPRIQTLSSVMENFFKACPGLPFPDMNEIEDSRTVPMLLLSNEQMAFGATSLLYEEELYSIADRLDQDLFIIPSSIHEVLILPAGMVESRDELDSMIREINRTHVGEGDVLSDRAYFFKKNEKRFYF